MIKTILIEMWLIHTYQVMSWMTDLMWVAPACLMTYSDQKTTSSRGDIGRSFINADRLAMLLRYLGVIKIIQLPRQSKIC